MKNKRLSKFTKRNIASIMILFMVFTFVPMIPDSIAGIDLSRGSAVLEAEAEAVPDPLCLKNVGTETAKIRLFKSTTTSTIVKLQYCTGTDLPDGNWKEYSTWYKTGTVTAGGTFDATKLPILTETVNYSTGSAKAAAGEEISLNPGVSLFFRASTPNETLGYDDGAIKNIQFYKFTMSGSIVVSGEITSLLNSTNTVLSAPENCYTRLFEECTSIISAENLILPSGLNERCYSHMFNGCTGLVTATNLPASSMECACYESMFGGCSSLVQAPTLPSTTLAPSCYSNMFSGCTSLTTMPNLPATTLAESCYSGMFSGCTNLDSPSTLPATTLAKSCYSGMFSGCTKFVTAPSLPVMELKESCYSGMFSGCTNLTTAPSLPATIMCDNCYFSMFKDCTSLVSAPVLPAETLASGCYGWMFHSCTKLASAPELPAKVLAENCYNLMFFMCIELTATPDLPATTLADSCYERMFDRCAKLTTASNLPATTLKGKCYKEMFYKCTSLTLAPELPAKTLTENCYFAMFGDSGVKYLPKIKAETLATDCFRYMFAGCTNLTVLTEGTDVAMTVLDDGVDHDAHYGSMFSGLPSANVTPGTPTDYIVDSTPVIGAVFYTLTGLYPEPKPEEPPTQTAVHHDLYASPTIIADSGATYRLSADGTGVAIQAKEGYELVDVTLNAMSKGKVDSIQGLGDGDKVVITTRRIGDNVASVISAIRHRVNTKPLKKNGKRYIQAYVTILEGADELEALKAEGYTIKYVFYRGEKKNLSDAKRMITSKTGKYLNTKGNPGKYYYYKAVMKIFDPNGKLVGATDLGQCKYGSRFFHTNG